jgi:hypothetical protein
VVFMTPGLDGTKTKIHANDTLAPLGLVYMNVNVNVC